MRTGVSYMGHHNPVHIKTDLAEMKQLGCDDVLVSAQENDFVHFTGKIQFTPRIAKDMGLRPLAIFWGALNLFGGGRSSQFLLEHPEGFQRGRDGAHRSAGCYVNRLCVARIKEMLHTATELGFEGYFVDEPTPLWECYCTSCRARYMEWYGGDLGAAEEVQAAEFRHRCVIEYVREIAEFCKTSFPHTETQCCVMPCDRDIWAKASQIEFLDNLGTDIYWVNEDIDVEEMTPMIRDLAALCHETGKIHHEWLQCWGVRAGREQRILDQGRILVREKPDALYVWAWKGQIGTTETCHDPIKSWEMAAEVLRMAKG